MWRRLQSVVRVLLGRRRFERGMTDELQFHVDAYAADLRRDGLAPEEALRRARAAFGGVEGVREECRRARGLRWWDELGQDVRYALRLMRRTPAFTAAAILSLGLGIGANTAIFSLIDAVLLRSLAVSNPHRAVLPGAWRGRSTEHELELPVARAIPHSDGVQQRDRVSDDDLDPGRGERR